MEINSNQEVVVEMAEAYLRQTGQLEYDQYNNRRMTFATPEEATSQELGYFDCSSYVTSVYTNAFGISAIPKTYAQNTKNYTAYAKQYYGQDGYADVVGYWEALGYTTTEEQQQVLNQVQALLQPGDILVYRHGSSSYGANYSESNLSGHAILYMGNNTFSHSTGTSFNDKSKLNYASDPTLAKDRATSEEYSKGTVQYLDGDMVLTIGASKRSLFQNTNDTVYNFSIIRPLARTVETPQLTQQMQCRLSIAGVSFEKLTSAGINSAVFRGQEITYTLQITNHYGTRYNGVSFKDVMPQGVSFVSSNFGAVVNGNEITGTFDITPNADFTLRWTVRVDADATAGALLCNQTTINGLLMKDITNSVSGYSQAQLQSVADLARQYATNSANFDDPMDFVRAIYQNALGIDLFGTQTAMTLVDGFALSTKATPTDYYYTFNGDSNYATMVAPNMYGGWDFYSGGDYADNNLIRTPYEHNFTLGDVIVCRWYQNTRVYVYVGNGELVAIDSLTNTCTLVQNGSEGWSKSGSVYVQNHLLGTLYAYQRYAVIRPSMVAN